MNSKITLQHQFNKEMSEGLQEDLLQLIHDKIDKLEGSYFQKVLTKEDAEIKIQVHILKNHDGKFEGKFLFLLDGVDYPYHNDVPFTEPFDVVSHAFKHLKEQLAD